MMEYWLPIIFAAVMGLALLIYIIVDGYDLGIGMLMPFASDSEKDRMVAAIGPFWDANETWIVLGVGILLIAFPKAHGIVLTSLYLPVTAMLVGLILRGVAFDFRAKVKTESKQLWNTLFALGSLIASCSQGWMLGQYVMGLQVNTMSIVFSIAIALTLPCLYILLGSGWLFIKTDGNLQSKAQGWAKKAFIPMGIGLLLVSISTPIVSEIIAEKWFSFPEAILLAPIPLISLAAFVYAYFQVQSKSVLIEGKEWHFFAALILLCLMAAIGLGYSLFPFIIINQLTIWETAASVPSLQFTLVGAVIAVPMILVYTIFIYRIFSGKSQDLSYE